MSTFEMNNAINAALNIKKVLRVAFYIRVSTSEQVSRENSLPAQKLALDEWCKKNNAVCVGVYADEGKTAAKEIRKRKEIHRMLKDVREGNIDLVVFTRFDRFTRNPEEYFKMMETMNAAGVQWKAIMQPELDLNTDMGQTLILFYLGMGKQEISNISERIKATAAVRVQKGSPITGSHSMPISHTIGFDEHGHKRVIRDPEKEPLVWEYIRHYELTHSHKKAMMHCNDMFGLSISYNSYKTMMKSTMMYGHFRGVDNYCPGYVTKERFDKWQETTKKNVRARSNNQTYIFSQMCKCGVCGHSMSGNSVTTLKGKNRYYYYRCNTATKDRRCKMLNGISEIELEEYMLSRIKSEIEHYISESEANAKKPVARPKVDVVKKLEKELERLNYQFRKERITVEEYDREYEDLVKRINEARARQVAIENPVQKDFTALRKIMEMDIESSYKTFTRDEKLAFWRGIMSGIIKEIKVNEDKTIELVFF